MKKALPYRILVWIVYLLVTFFIVSLSLDFLLWHLDPLGMRVMAYNVIKLSRSSSSHPTGYQYAAAHYDLGFWQMEILADGIRNVPDSGNGDCVIAFVGDSMTWGQGVSDNETFVNRLATHFPDMMILNTARSGYGVENVAAAIDHYPADGYIWFIFYNDAVPFMTIAPRFETPSALELYAALFVFSYRQPQNYNNATWGDYAPLAQSIVGRNDIFTFGFDGDPLAQEAAAWGTVLIPNPHMQVSVADGHPNTQGHQEIADSLLPHIREFVSDICQT